ncbi:hypothetical protein [Stigmatella aurantiaca]|uniref:Uncharacterized protein n=1 Tax=Stigmatella aurantiaca (strain DW4/3-1) TaxID=378806 RepID=E3FJ74_STIAD|nr:hypothetical protein [Stigmatella aurantiaca]ADO69169.1 uncharacterized protein STAUR_1365 [Stigmatella aurantiaca DW4/3-1]
MKELQVVGEDGRLYRVHVEQGTAPEVLAQGEGGKPSEPPPKPEAPKPGVPKPGTPAQDPQPTKELDQPGFKSSPVSISSFRAR